MTPQEQAMRESHAELERELRDLRQFFSGYQGLKWRAIDKALADARRLLEELSHDR